MDFESTFKKSKPEGTCHQNDLIWGIVPCLKLILTNCEMGNVIILTRVVAYIVRAMSTIIGAVSTGSLAPNESILTHQDVRIRETTLFENAIFAMFMMLKSADTCAYASV